VCGSTNIYAIGDCVAGRDKPLLQDVATLFRTYDRDNSGNLDEAETQQFFAEARLSYPHLAFYIARAEKLFQKHDTNGDGKLSLDEFKQLCVEIDKGARELPATAQCNTTFHRVTRMMSYRLSSGAEQMGTYVGNVIAKRVGSSSKADTSPTLEPFEYRHAGSFSYVGDGSAVMEVDLPVVGKVVLKGSVLLFSKLPTCCHVFFRCCCDGAVARMLPFRAGTVLRRAVEELPPHP
jgi:hypothetical protein